MAEAAKTEAPEINATLLAVILIFIPGILCYGIVASLAEKKNRDNLTIFLQIFMYGVFSYLFLYLMHHFIPSVFPDDSAIPFLHPVDFGKAAIDPAVIAWASVFGVIQGLIVTLSMNRQYLMALSRKIGLTERFGDSDVWTLLLNSTETDNWVTIRHKERELVYQGYVKGFSSGNETRELLLMEVRVFDPDRLDASGVMQQVAAIPFLYMTFVEDDVVLEFGAKPT
jgi:hypothetical protein